MVDGTYCRSSASLPLICWDNRSQGLVGNPGVVDGDAAVTERKSIFTAGRYYIGVDKI